MAPLIITRKHPRNIMLMLCSVFLITILCEGKYISARENDSPSQQVDGEKVIVEVNGIKLTQNEIDKEIHNPLTSIIGTRLEDEFEFYKRSLEKMAIEDFIALTLLGQEIDKQNIVVSEDELNQALDEVKATIPKGMTLETALKQSGTDIEGMREKTKFHLRVKKLFESQIKNDYTPSDEAIKQYYSKNKRKFDSPETVHARHILIKSDEKDDEKTIAEKKSKIEALRKQLIEGADFGKLAKESSECPSKEKGGDLGTFIRGIMPKPIEDGAFSQKVNEIGPIVQTKHGYHIIQVLAHHPAREKSFDEVKKKIREEMIQNNRRELRKNYIEELKKKAKIVYYTSDATGISQEIKVVGSPFRGPADAPVVVFVFSDFQCPACAKISPLLGQILDTYPNRVKLVYKIYPSRDNKISQKAAAAALAAKRQGKFWEFHDLLFENHSELSDLKIKEISEWLDLNWEKLSKDMENPEIISIINRDKSEGDRAGIEEVPTIFINGQVLKPITLLGVKAAIENELQKLGKRVMGTGAKLKTGNTEYKEGDVIRK